MVKKIDFHIHTVSNPDKDTEFEFDPEWLKEYVSKSNLDGIAITNHNLFDIENFKCVSEALKLVDSSISVFPGIELDIAGGHSLLIYDNNSKNIEELNEANNELRRLNLGRSGSLTIEQLKSIFPSWQQGLFVYEYGKSKSISFFWDELKEATHAAGVNRAPMFIRRELNNSEDSSLLFSDSHATYQGNERNDISKLRFKNTFIDTDTLDFLALKKTINDKNVSLSEKMIPGRFNLAINGDSVEFSAGLNLLIGDRGTGKSFLLEHFNSDMSGDVTYLRQFQTAINAESDLKTITKEHAISARTKWVQQRSQYFENIKRFFDSKKPNSKIDDYIENLKIYGKSYAAASAAQKINLLRETKKYIATLDWLKEALTKLKNLQTEKRIWSIEGIGKYKGTVTQLYSEMASQYEKLLYEQKRDTFLNEILSEVRSSIRRTTGVEAPPEFDIISPYIYPKKREQIKHQTAALVNDTMDLESLNISDYKLVTKIKPISTADEFLKYHGITASVHRKLIIPYISKQFDVFFENLIDMGIVKPTQSLGEFVSIIETELQTHNGAKASGGQAAGFVLMNKLDDATDTDVILLDEPEISLDSKFITKQLVPKLQELAKSHIVVVATHNSNVGSLLHPNQIILTQYQNEINKYVIASGDYSSGKVNTPDGKKPFFDDFVDAMESGLINYENKGKEYASINR